MTPWWLVTVLVAGADVPAPHFATEIIPILTKAGCNSGACHGAAAGRGGFNLSLWGSDPAADFESIVQSFKGRRIHLDRPGDSLLLKKPTGQLKHGGDIVLQPEGAGAALLEKWIAAGAPQGQPRRLTRLEVQAKPNLLEKVGDQSIARAIAHFEDGPGIDVTAWTVFTPGDPTALVISAAMDPGTPATFVINRPGNHTVVARFLDRVIPVILTVPVGQKPVVASALPRNNWIDDEINQSLALLRLPPCTPADDATFLRRVSLGLTGTLPKPTDLVAFLADQSTDKREKLVDRLLASDDFADYWTLKMSRLLQVRSLPNDTLGVEAYTTWLRQSIVGTQPMGLDQWAKALVTATGDSHQVGPANFARQSGDARAQAELVGKAFLGVRLRCANCHNHPLDRWTQDDYHGLAAIFARLDRGRVVKVAQRGEVTNPRTGQPAVPRLPGGEGLASSTDARIDFANWLVGPDNPLFARAQVNRIWKSLFGRGLVEPVDDLRDTNPATHPALLEKLALEFQKTGYDTKRLLRLITLSEAYGRSSVASPGQITSESFYTHFTPYHPEPEVLADAFSQVLGIAEAYPGKPAGTRAITLWDPLSPAPSLDILGRCQRGASCEESVSSAGLPARLHLLNGPLLNQRVGAPDSRLTKLLASGKSNRDIVIEFYRAGLAKDPTEQELAVWLARLETDSPEDRQTRLEDFVWSLLNSRGFTTNH